MLRTLCTCAYRASNTAIKRELYVSTNVVLATSKQRVNGIRLNSTTPTPTTTTNTEPPLEWWSPPEAKAPPPIVPEEEGAEGEKKTPPKVVQIGGVRPDGRSPRWYTDVRVEEVDGGYTVLMDGRNAMTISKPLVVPTRAFASAIAAEWMSQGKYIRLDSLPLTKLASTAIDHMSSSRHRITSNLVRTFEADLTCARIEELLDRQRKAFNPMIQWFTEKFGYKPKVSILLGKLQHPPQLIDKVTEYLESLDDFHLQTLDNLASATRSIVLPLYLAHGKIGINEAISAARIEEDTQIAVWGSVPGTHDVDKSEVSIRIATGALAWQLLNSK